MRSTSNVSNYISIRIFIWVLLFSSLVNYQVAANPNMESNQITQKDLGGEIITNHNFQTHTNEQLFDELSIQVNYPDSQEVILSNRNSSHFSMETSKEETRKWHGLVHNDINYLTNIWYTDGETILSKDNIVDTILTPIYVTINYDSGGKETIFMPDNLDSMIFEFQSSNFDVLTLIPTFAMRIEYYSGSNINDYTLSIDADTVAVKTSSSKYIVFVTNEGSFNSFPNMVNREFVRDDIRNDGSDIENLYSPGEFQVNSNSVIAAVGIGQSIDQAKDIAQYTLSNYENLRLEKKNRLSNLVLQQTFHSDLNSELNLNEMYQWLIISLDKLKMKRFDEGLYAGYHWFDDYWGRDTFISFKGGLLSIGDWELATKTLQTMASKQQNNPSVPSTYGRVPNRVTTDTGNNDYSTADGTGWFVKSIADYVRLNNDLNFAQEILPNVELAINGEEMRVDNLGFVTHQDRETWMDAQTGSVIQTPRGNRAVEIQALLYQMYYSYKELLNLLNAENDIVVNVQSKIDNLLINLKTYFWNELGRTLYDHLDLDGFQDLDKRPNQFLALSLLPDNFLSARDLSRLMDNNLELITNIGVKTLSSKDPSYKGTHDSNAYHHDAAYHNGDIWPWLSGATIELLLKT
ncbi:MAG: amylo-alpha-1,6-glucosidase, partial [Candidatus Kariarchaeaceae archaeon]